MKGKLFFLVCFLLFQFFFSQKGRNNYFPPSPEGSVLMKYVDVPINYSTGVVNYEIPIHTISLKDISIPISLSYQSSGFKPSEVASSVGLGWDLIAGGKIVQNVIGKNDFSSAPSLDFPNDRDFKLPGYVGYLPGQSTVANIPQSYLDSIKSPNTDYFKFNQIVEYGLDSKPDLFYYSIPNKSGKFFFSKDFIIKQIPFGMEKIIRNSTGGFEITDVKGIKYFFNSFTENLNYTNSSCENCQPSYQQFIMSNSTNSSYTFYLTKIVTPSKEEISFEYQKVKYNITNDREYTRYYHWWLGGSEKLTTYYSEVTSNALSKIIVNNSYEIDFIYNKYRKDIKSHIQQFSPKTLDQILIRKNQNIVDSFDFNYGYFGINDNSYNPNVFESTNNNEDGAFRLKLKSFKKNGENPYYFNYGAEFSTNRLTTCIDHWGYFSTSNCSKYTMNLLFGDLTTNVKKPDLIGTKMNILEKVVLPTKGSVSFNYELNDYYGLIYSNQEYAWASFSVYSNSDDVFSNQTVTNEIFFTVPNNVATIPNITFYLFDDAPTTVNNYASVSIFNENNQLINTSSFFGSGFQSKPYAGDYLSPGKTYRLVLECVDNIENQDKYVQINFLIPSENITPNTNNNHDNIGGLRIKNITTSDTNNNEITKKNFEYKENNITTSELYEIPYYFDEYNYYNPPSNGEVSLFSGHQNLLVQYSRIPYDIFGFNGYHVFYKKVTEKFQDINNIDNNIKTEKYFTFFDDNSFGEQSYPSKISYGWKRGLESKINEYKENKIIRRTTFEYSFLDTPNSNKASVEPGMHLDSPMFPNEFHQRTLDVSIFIESVNFWHIFQYSTSKLISAWFYKNKETVEDFLENGNILKTETNFIYSNNNSAQLSKINKIFPDNTIKETVFSYAHEKGNQYLIDKNMISIPLQTSVIKKRNAADVGIGISATELLYPFSQSEANINTQGLPLPMRVKTYEVQQTSTSGSPSSVEVTYDRYDNKGNIEQYTTKEGIPTTIIWGYNQTQPIAKIEGAIYSDVQNLISSIVTASNTDAAAIPGNDETTFLAELDLFRKNLALSNYQITTYTYDPLIGVRSITPPSGIREVYFYDTANRLEKIVDINGKILKEFKYNYKH